MLVRIFSIPIVGGERLVEDMNAFLRSKRVLHMEHSLVKFKKEAFWTYHIKYMEETPGADSISGYTKAKIDYRETLDETTFNKFSRMREMRKALSKSENIPAYTIMTDAQMAELAQIEELTIAKMKTVKGLGEKTVEKYGKHFMAIEI